MQARGDPSPLSAAAIDLSSSATNAIKTVQSGSDHFVRIEEIYNADQVYNTLEDWMVIGKLIPHVDGNIILKKAMCRETGKPASFTSALSKKDV